MPKSFKASNDRMAQPAGTIFDPGNRSAAGSIQVGCDQVRQEQEQSAKFRMKSTRCQISTADIRHGGHIFGMGLVGSLLVPASWQFGKALFLEDRGDDCRAEWLAIVGQHLA